MFYFIKKIILRYFIFLGLFLIPFSIFASNQINLEGPQLIPKIKLYISPQNSNIYVGSIFNVPIRIDTKGTNINTVKVELSFDPSKVSIIKPPGGDSILGIWFEAPTYNNKTGTATIIGIIPNGVNTNSGLITTITFKALSLGKTTIKLTDYSSVNLNDGEGSNAVLDLVGGNYNIVPVVEIKKTEPIITPIIDKTEVISPIISKDNKEDKNNTPIQIKEKYSLDYDSVSTGWVYYLGLFFFIILLLIIIKKLFKKEK